MTTNERIARITDDLEVLICGLGFSDKVRLLNVILRRTTLLLDQAIITYNQ